MLRNLHVWCVSVLALSFVHAATCAGSPSLSLPPDVAIARHLTQDAGGDLPANPRTTCSTQTLLAVAASAEGCLLVVLSGVGNEVCCGVVDDVFGVESDKDTRNCLCVPEVLEDVLELGASGGAAPFTQLVDSCNSEFGTKIGYHKDVGGLCPNAVVEPTIVPTGMDDDDGDIAQGSDSEQDDPAVLEVDTDKNAGTVEERTFLEWVSDLKHEPAFLVPFIMSVPASIGSLIFIWNLISATV